MASESIPTTFKPTVSAVWTAYKKHLAASNVSYDATAANNLVRNHQMLCSSDATIYGEIAKLFPHVGCPLAVYEKEGAQAHVAAQAAVKRVRKERTSATARVESEYDNKRRCIELENAVLNQQSSDLCTPQFKAPRLSYISPIHVGEYVLVKADLSPGKCSHGGTGFVTSILPSDDPSAPLTYDVKYDECNGTTRTECNIPLDRLTLTTLPIFSGKKSRKKNALTSQVSATAADTPLPTRTLFEALEHACRRNRKKGWRRLDLGFSAAKDKKSDAFFLAITADYNSNFGSKVVPEDEIYKAAEAVWQALPSSKVARGFILAYRLTKLVIQHGGGNAFLSDGTMHQNIRNDFYDTETGVRPKTHVLV